MAKAKAKRKPKVPPKRVPFGGDVVNFKRGARTRFSRCSAAPRCRVRDDKATLGVREAAPPRDAGARPHTRLGGEQPDDHGLAAVGCGLQRADLLDERRKTGDPGTRSMGPAE